MEYRRLLDDPTYDAATRADIEDRLFGLLEDLKGSEELVRECDDSIATLRQQDTDASVGILVAVMVAAILVMIVLAIAASR